MGYRLQNKHLTTEKQMTTAFGHVVESSDHLFCKTCKYIINNSKGGENYVHTLILDYFIHLIDFESL